ncbi:MAG: exodeoxyribonuclease VII small subunit [Erysipelotrichaceae bacterium]|nr:exodeoxyribonuclease VII small subunit [Erysipelotrichaceae bacterium]
MEKMTFEEKLNRLEEIVQKIDSNTLGLEESMKVYEEGMNLIKDLEKTLEEANAKFANINNSEEIINKVIK